MLSFRCQMDRNGGATRTGARLVGSGRSCREANRFILETILYTVMCLVVSVTCQSTTPRSTIAANSTAMDANMTLVSEGGVFEVGFTSGVLGANRSSSPVYTLAIWYAQPPTPAKTVVWVADTSMALSSIAAASLSLSPRGDLQVHDTSGAAPKLVWNSNTASLNVTNATILDTGNLVLRNRANQVVWQSFDTPTDTLLPTQIFAANSSHASLTAWQNDNDWSKGLYSLRWSSGNSLYASWQNPYKPWNNTENSTAYWTTLGSIWAFSQVSLTPEGDFQAMDTAGKSTSIGASAVLGVQDRLVRMTMDKDGNFRMCSWSIGRSNWTVEWKAVADDCSVSGYCGPYSMCNNGTCTCPSEFQLVDATDRRLGCQRIVPATYANCGGNVSANIVNDTFGSVVKADWGWNDLYYYSNVRQSYCKEVCLASCDCQGITTTIPDPSTGIVEQCWHKKTALLNGKFDEYRESYLRIAGTLQQHKESVASRDPNLNLKIVASTLGAAVGILALLSCALGSYFLAWRKRKRQHKGLHDKWVAAKGAMVRFTYREIVIMTANFESKIGEGGFGTVFKGRIGHDDIDKNYHVKVAVKRLTKELTSQVEKEFLNEVDSVGLIHHVHLVSLLGYCAEADHRLLVYEYADKGSLDGVLFRGEKLGLLVLEWRPRFAIAIQTARGLAYLHDDCIQRIIHCDVKPENILLDSLYNAKVADFGLSRIMNRDQKSQTRSRTMHIRGTFGYLAPEYWAADCVSITNKVDVFSYGMVLLEIISGRRNLRFTSDPSSPVDVPDLYFPTWAFPKIETDGFMEVVDPSLTGIVDPDQVRRALQVAYWCINENPHLRPSMSEVVQMLQGHVAIELPVPRPGFFENLEFGKESEVHHRWSGSSGIYATSSVDKASQGLLSKEQELYEIEARG